MKIDKEEITKKEAGDTFGPINWWDYYRETAPLAIRVEPSPCNNCSQVSDCHRAIDPDSSSACPRFTEWVRTVWPAVTGKKKAAPSGANTESGRALTAQQYQGEYITE